MAIERTLSILKPDALEKGVIGKIISRFEEKGLASGRVIYDLELRRA